MDFRHATFLDSSKSTSSPNRSSTPITTLMSAFGGALGSLARYWVGTTIANRFGTKLHYGTLVINITACVVIGFSLAFLARRTELSSAWRFLVPIGFVGAYSTFSTFEWEIFTDLEASAFLIGALYVMLSLVLGLIAVWCGVLAARAIS